MILPLYTLNFLLSLGGLLLLFVTLILFIDYFFFERKFFIRFVSAYVWPILFVTTVGSVALSLVYSEYFGFIPCSLCWLQRIALYPQALFTIMAVKSKEHRFYPTYSIALSIGGLIVALYHYVYQLIPKEAVTSGFMPCLADGSGDCAVKVIEEFGFVTFPLLSAITFAFLIVLYLNLRRGI